MLGLVMVAGSLTAMDGYHVAGVESAMYIFTSEEEAQYGLPLGGGGFYDYTFPTKVPISLGFSSGWYGSPARKDGYIRSDLLLLNLNFGVTVARMELYDAEITLVPYLSYSHYLRWITTVDALFFGHNPAPQLGVEFRINTGKISHAIGLYCMVVLDKLPVFLPGIRIKSGIKFRGSE